MSVNIQPWLDKADGDWRAMQRLHTAVDPALADVICFHAQQCVEKLMKAVIIARGDPDPPKIHDLRPLSRLIEAVEPAWQAQQSDLARLSLSAVLMRYPGDSATPQDAEWSVETAARLRGGLLGLLGVGADAGSATPGR